MEGLNNLKQDLEKYVGYCKKKHEQKERGLLSAIHSKYEHLCENEVGSTEAILVAKFFVHLGEEKITIEEAYAGIYGVFFPTYYYRVSENEVISADDSELDKKNGWEKISEEEYWKDFIDKVLKRQY